MKQSKVFNWLYFIILLLPIMFVFIPMINNYQPSIKNESVEIVTNGYQYKNVFSFFENIAYRKENGFYDIRFNELYPYLSYYGYIDGDQFSLVLIDGNDHIFGFKSYFSVLTFSSGDFVCGLDISEFYSLPNSSNYITLNNDDDDNIYESFTLNTNHFDEFVCLIFDASNFFQYDYIYTFYYQDYVINTEYNSIIYDFSVKMNDSFLIVGDLTEWVSDNIIDLSTNDYVFFAWTYSIYIFVVSLLWLLVSFLLFIIKFANRWLNGIYEKW